MAAAKGKAAEGAAEKSAASKAKTGSENPQNKMVKCKNISNKAIPVKGSVIEPGEEGKCTAAQLRQFNKYLEKA